MKYLTNESDWLMCGIIRNLTFVKRSNYGDWLHWNVQIIVICTLILFN